MVALTVDNRWPNGGLPPLAQWWPATVGPTLGNRWHNGGMPPLAQRWPTGQNDVGPPVAANVGPTVACYLGVGRSDTNSAFSLPCA